MQFPNNKVTELTEKIMRRCSNTIVGDIMKLEPREYNKLFEHVYTVINDDFKEQKRYKEELDKVKKEQAKMEEAYAKMAKKQITY